MAGSYCKYCGHRCFVYRIVPDGVWKGWSGHMATCVEGRAFDSSIFGGYDSSNSVNPLDRMTQEEFDDR